MRAEYHNLCEVGALTIADSSLNMLKKIMSYQNKLSAELSEQLNTTMQENFMNAFNLIHHDTESEENITPLLNMQT